MFFLTCCLNKGLQRPETKLTVTYQTFALVLTPIVAWFAEIFILGIMRGVGEMGGSRLGTSSCPIDLTFLPAITINLRNLETEWADLNLQSAFLQTGLVYISHFLMNQPFLAGWRPLVKKCIAYFGVPSHLFFFFFCLNN